MKQIAYQKFRNLLLKTAFNGQKDIFNKWQKDFKNAIDPTSKSQKKKKNEHSLPNRKRTYEEILISNVCYSGSKKTSIYELFSNDVFRELFLLAFRTVYEEDYKNTEREESEIDYTLEKLYQKR